MVANGINVLHKDHEGKTAFDIARELNHQEIAEYFEPIVLAAESSSSDEEESIIDRVIDFMDF